MTQLLIATNNKGKIKELQALLGDLKVELVTPSRIGLELEVLEDGTTYAENAARKAVAFANASGLASLADDSGLEVDALGGAPGLYSARYGAPEGDKLTYPEMRKLLVKNLGGKPRPWTARFRATVAIVIPPELTPGKAKSLELAEGTCEGEIIPEERGMGGFGYDPIFLLPKLGRTMAELSMEEKNRLSHRARAVMKVREYIRQLV